MVMVRLDLVVILPTIVLVLAGEVLWVISPQLELMVVPAILGHLINPETFGNGTIACLQQIEL